MQRQLYRIIPLQHRHIPGRIRQAHVPKRLQNGIRPRTEVHRERRDESRGCGAASAV